MSKYSDKQKKLAEGEIGIDYSQIVEQSIIDDDAKQDRKDTDYQLKLNALQALVDKEQNFDKSIERVKLNRDALMLRIKQQEDDIVKWKAKCANYEQHIIDAPKVREKLKIQKDLLIKEIKKLKQ